MAYATPTELATWMGRGTFTTDETARAQLLLDVATGKIDTKADQSLEQSQETVTLDGTGRAMLILPRWPVTDVSSVVLDGTTLTADEDYTWSQSGILERKGTVWPLARRAVTVTFTAGYNPIPNDIRGLTLDLAQRGWDQTAGLIAEDIGDWRRRWDTAGMDLTDDELSLIDHYRAEP